MAEDPDDKVTTAVDFLLSSLSPAVDELDSKDLAAVEATVPHLRIARAGGAFAFTAEGVLDGMPFFLHSRRGRATLDVGGEPTEAPLYTASIDFFPVSGAVDVDEFGPLLRSLIRELDRAPFPYPFRGRAVRIVPASKGFQLIAEDSEEVFVSKGHTAEEAFAAIAMPDPALHKLGLTDEVQEEIFKLQSPDPKPLKQDDRSFPVETPNFTVNV